MVDSEELFRNLRIKWYQEMVSQEKDMVSNAEKDPWDWYIYLHLPQKNQPCMYVNIQFFHRSYGMVFHLVSKATCRAFQPQKLPPKFMARTAESKVNQPQRVVFFRTPRTTKPIYGKCRYTLED